MDSQSSNTTTQKLELPELPVLGNQRTWDTTKIVLRSISMCFAVTVLAEVIALNSAPNARPPSTSYIIVSIIISWNAAEFIVICVRRSKARGITPAAHVGVDLLLWLGAVAMCVVQSFVMGSYTSNSYGSGNNIEYFVSQYYAIYISHVGFIGVLAILHFILFTRACVEVDRRKKDRRVQQLILAMQIQGHDPQNFPLSTFTQARSSSSAIVPQRPADRDFGYKYNHSIAPVPELHESAHRVEMSANSDPRELPADNTYPEEMPVSPEDLRNQKVLISSLDRR